MTAFFWQKFDVLKVSRLTLQAPPPQLALHLLFALSMPSFGVSGQVFCQTSSMPCVFDPQKVCAVFLFFSNNLWIFQRILQIARTKNMNDFLSTPKIVENSWAQTFASCGSHRPTHFHVRWCATFEGFYPTQAPSHTALVAHQHNFQPMPGSVLSCAGRNLGSRSPGKRIMHSLLRAVAVHQLWTRTNWGGLELWDVVFSSCPPQYRSFHPSKKQVVLLQFLAVGDRRAISIGES